jgi:hypothetical protein
VSFLLIFTVPFIFSTVSAHFFCDFATVQRYSSNT